MWGIRKYAKISSPVSLDAALACLSGHPSKREKTLATKSISKLKSYETMYIVRPNLDEEPTDKVIAQVEEFIKSHGGEKIVTDKKGRKRLAYEVNKMRDGFYVLTTFDAPAESIAVIKRMMTLSEDIIRTIVCIAEPEGTTF